MARVYMRGQFQADPGLVEVCYLPTNAGPREIRFVEVNELLGDRTDEWIEPIVFRVDAGTENEHEIIFLDVTPNQWGRIQARKLPLPAGWSLEDAVRHRRVDDE